MTVIAAGSMDYVTESLNDLILLLLILVPVYLLISAVGAFFLAKRAMRPIRQITKTAQAIESGDMAQRIHNVDSNDEVGELADTFNGMLDTLEISFRRERQFTSDASHELRTPITVIAACTEDALGDNGAVNCRENLETIKDEAARMTKIISQLLMLSRGYEGRCHFEPDRICLYDMVDSVSEELKDTAEKMCISIHNDVGKNIDVTADQSLMTQLFVNLIGNAVKYGSAGGNVWLNAREQDGQLHIEVSDDGIGISEDDQTHIFERFYRADKARDRTGSGLGLAIVKWIVDLHSGAIGVKSSLGHGTTFEITLPNK
jgi:signal transduction histidine kinase